MTSSSAGAALSTTRPGDAQLFLLQSRAVGQLQVGVGQLEHGLRPLPRVGREHVGRGPSQPQLIAVQIAAIVVIEAQAVLAAQGHIAARLGQEEQVLVLDHDGVGDAARDG
jgi:hypothetical protein